MKYEYSGKFDGELQRRIICECAAMAARFGIPASDFDDVVHEAIMAGMKKIDRYDPRRGTVLWTFIQYPVRHAAHDACFAIVRRGYQQASMETVQDVPAAVKEYEDVMNAVDLLPPRETLVIRMRYGLIDGKRYSPGQVAELMGVSKRTVERLQQLAMNNLREALKDG